MFSELCRETLRKAAVCYSAGRTGSPSPSPPTSPPSSPAKETKIVTNIELANVNCANDQVRELSSSNIRAKSQYANQGTITSSTDSREITNKKSNSTDNMEKRTSMFTNFTRKWRRERRRVKNNASMSDPEIRECRSSSCERIHINTNYYYQNKTNNNIEYYHQRRECKRYRRDSSGSSTDPDDSSTSGDEAGGALEETNQRSSSAHNRHSLTKDSKRRSLYDEDSLDGDHPNDKQGRESAGSGKDVDRVKLVRDRQNEERLRKLEELKQQALSAQRFREQREVERRRRIDELRSRDTDRRSQVEERKRLIWEAERERREAILRKNQEREARIEAKKKNERSHIVFAFGSSTPRMLEPADTGGSTFWGTRRATSTTNVMMFPAAQPLTRRSSERELDGSKKRATSAGGLDRKPGEDMRMSLSMYEVFNWNSSLDPSITNAKNKRASLSLPPTTDIFAIDDKSDSDTRRATMQRATSGDESDAAPGTPSSIYLRVNRRRTDLMPTIPSPRDGAPTSGRSSSAKTFTRSPGRTYSMSRLDQLAQPRKPRIGELTTLTEQHQHQQHHHNNHHDRQTSQTLGASSMSRSMSHLAAPGSIKTLKRSDNSRSMGTLPGAVHLPRPTRAERLRRKAREQHQQQQQQQQQQSQGIRSGEVTPNSPSRPHSSMSQQSGSSSVASSNVNLRPRTSTPRRPRPASIAGTGVTVTERHNLLSDVKTKDSSKPPLPKVHTTPKKPSSSATPRLSTGDTTTLIRKSSDRLIKSAKASPRITPKATPLQSPGAEQPLISLIRQNTTEIIKNDESIGKEMKESKVIDDNKYEEKKDQGNEKCHDINETNNATISEIISTSSPISTSNEKIVKEDVTRTITPIAHLLSKDDSDKKLSPEADADIEEVVDMSASMIAKIRITTEEEAKAALAERRRFAREQAEREAELERQRLEEEARQEEERLRAEEEEQRRFEEETIRLANEAKEAEEQRLQLAIEDARRREEEDRKRREEEAKQKLEKEEADRKAREEAEKQRLEMVERLKKEEEERIARRKRVEAIMKRTRGNSQANTPTKGDGGDGDKSKDDSPIEESKPVPGNNKVDDVMTASLISEATQQFINAEQQDNNHHAINNSPIDIVRNGTTHTNGINNDINKATLLENNQGNGDDGELNGHHMNHGNGINTQSITLDNATIKQNNVTNNLLDFSEFDTLSNSSSGPIIMLSSNIANEDSLNSNLNPTAIPFNPMVNPFVPIAANANTNPFQDNFTNNKTQDNNQVPDLLS